MTDLDRGRPLAFGGALRAPRDDPGAAARTAIAADRAGLDLLSITDHPYDPALLESWTVLATVVPVTTRAHLYLNVANLPLRPVPMLAKQVATLDLLSGGRIELGLGAGAVLAAAAAMGAPRLTPRESVDALEEAVGVLRAAWSGSGPLEAPGPHHPVRGIDLGPAPAHPVGIWIGAYGPRTLEITGRLADGWSGSARGDEAQLLGWQRRIDDAVAAAGRPPDAVRRAHNFLGRIGGRPDGRFRGPVAHWVDELVRCVRVLGLDTFVFLPVEDHDRQLRTYAEEVVPAVRAAVAAERGVGAAT